jgi:hypothetical protein
MTIGPAPMIMIERMSVLFGMGGLRAVWPGARAAPAGMDSPGGGKLPWL